MQRRKLLQNLAFGLATIKSFFLFSESQASTPDGGSVLTQLPIIMDKNYHLPLDPKDGLTISFSTDKKLEHKQILIIPQKGHTIMGAITPLEVDVPENFRLTFDQKTSCWLIS